MIPQNSKFPAEKYGWYNLGPGGGGAMFVPNVSPHSPDTAIVACDMTGTYITHDGGQNWRQLNMKSTSFASAFDPFDPNVIYLGSTGLYRSQDRGMTWKLIFPDPEAVELEVMVGDHAGHKYISKDNWPGGSVETIAIDPENNSNIYIGIKSEGLLLFSSHDGGKKWRELCRPEGKEFLKLYVNNGSNNQGKEIFAFTDTAVYRITDDNGLAEKIELPSGVEKIISADCGIDPDTGTDVFYMVTPARYENNGVFSGVFRSGDRGKSWTELDGGLFADFAGPRNGQRREFKCIATAAKDAGTVYVSVLRYPEIFSNPMPEMNYLGIMKSIDMGNTWQWVLKIGDKNPENLIGGWQERSYDTDWMGSPLGMAVCPANPDVCYYTGYGMTTRTTDGGKLWKQVYSRDNPDGTSTGCGLEVTTCYGVHFDPFDKDHIVISYTDIGMHQSHDGGRSWRHSINGVPRLWINTCYWMVFDPEVKGKAWSVWSYCHDLPRPKMFARGDFDKYVGGVCRSEDGLVSWQKSNQGMPENSVPTSIVLDPKSPAGNRTLYVAAVGKGVFKSVDDGKTWELKNNGITGNLNAWELTLTPDGLLYLVVVRGLKNGKEVDGSLYLSRDGAESWERLPLPEGVNAPNSLAFDPKNPKTMYLACWPRTMEGKENYGGVYMTEDGGVSWKNIFDKSAHAYAVAVDPKDTSVLYLVTFNGSAYRSGDRGCTWERLKGYNFKWGHRPVIDPWNRDMLYITTFGSSVWYGPAKGSKVEFEDIYPLRK